MGFTKKDETTKGILYELTGTFPDDFVVVYREYTQHIAYANKVANLGVINLSDGTILKLRVRKVKPDEPTKKLITTYASLVKLHIGLNITAGHRLVQER